MTAQKFIWGVHNEADADYWVSGLNGSFPAQRLPLLREKYAEHGVERKRLMAMIESKGKDISRLTQQIAQFHGKVAVLTKSLEDKSYQLYNRSREQFITKTMAKHFVELIII